MKFRTIPDIKKSNFTIDYTSNIFSIGSCFTIHIGEKLDYYKFPVLINPFGTLYNPVSVKKALEIIINKQIFRKEDLNKYNGKYFSFYHDTTFSDTDIDKALEKINRSVEKSHKFLKNTNLLFITFGTSHVYRYLKNKTIVSNCHKIPASKFERVLLSPEDIITPWKTFTDHIRQFNEDIKIVFTVSPVRHLKDGAVMNQLSKSILLYSIHELIKTTDNAEYFPSYEIFMDDLRDYRFYAEDMVHAGTSGINYVWEKFKDTYISDSELPLMKSIQKIISASQHKPFNSTDIEYKKFLTTQLEKIEDMKKQYPHINLQKEKIFFKNQLEKNFGNNHS